MIDQPICQAGRVVDDLPRFLCVWCVGVRLARCRACGWRSTSEGVVVGFGSNCARAYGRIRAELERRGAKIGPNDLIIASTAVANGATLITANVREFMRVPGLSVENWEEVSI